MMETQEFSGKGWTWWAMAGNCLEQVEMTGNVWKYLEISGNGNDKNDKNYTEYEDDKENHDSEKECRANLWTKGKKEN